MSIEYDETAEAMAQQRAQQERTMQAEMQRDRTVARAQKLLVTRQRMFRYRVGDEVTIELDRDYIEQDEAGNYRLAEQPHEAKSFRDAYEAWAVATDAQRSWGGNWQVMPASVIADEQRQENRAQHTDRGEARGSELGLVR